MSIIHFRTACTDDHRFYNCLLNVRSLPSELVGIIFFNLLQTPCFAYDHPVKCVETNR